MEPNIDIKTFDRARQDANLFFFEQMDMGMDKLRVINRIFDTIEEVLVTQ